MRLTRPVAEVRGPERIREVVQQRLSRLSPETSRMIELAAVPARDSSSASSPLLPASTRPRSPRPSCTPLATGSSRSCRKRSPTCRFTHELVRRAVYDPIKRVRLPQLHLLVGEALEQRLCAPISRASCPSSPTTSRIAAPLAGAERAVDYNLRAAEAATASVAYREAAARLSTALELGISDPRERARVQAELGHLYYEAAAWRNPTRS